MPTLSAWKEANDDFEQLMLADPFVNEKYQEVLSADQITAIQTLPYIEYSRTALNSVQLITYVQICGSLFINVCVCGGTVCVQVQPVPSCNV